MKNILIISAILLFNVSFSIAQKDLLYFTSKGSASPHGGSNSSYVDSTKIIISGLDVKTGSSLLNNKFGVINSIMGYVIKNHTYTFTNDLKYKFIKNFDILGSFKIYDKNDKLISNINSNIDIEHFKFVSPKIGYGIKNYFIQHHEVNESNILYRTSDSAKTWIPVVDFNELNPSKKHRIDYINFIDENKGFVCVFQYDTIGELNLARIFLKTEDAGNTWSICNLPKKYVEDVGNHAVVITELYTNIIFTNKNDGYMLTRYYSDMLVTNNGGLDWKIKPIVYNPNASIVINKYYSIDKKSYYPFVLHLLNYDEINKRK